MEKLHNFSISYHIFLGNLQTLHNPASWVHIKLQVNKVIVRIGKLGLIVEGGVQVSWCQWIGWSGSCLKQNTQFIWFTNICSKRAFLLVYERTWEVQLIGEPARTETHCPSGVLLVLGFNILTWHAAMSPRTALHNHKVQVYDKEQKVWLSLCCCARSQVKLFQKVSSTIATLKWSLFFWIWMNKPYKF